MSRRRTRGRTLIETWKHYRYAVSVDIYLDKESGEFHGEYAEETIVSKSLEEVREKLTKLVEESMVLEWIPIIELTASGSVSASMDVPVGRHATTEEEVDSYDERREAGDARLHLNFRRYWLAKRPDGKWLTCHIWHSQDAEGKSDRYVEGRGIHDPLPRRLNSSEFYIANHEKDFCIPWTEKASPHREFEGDTHYVRYTEELWNGLNEIARRMDSLRERIATILGTPDGRKKLVDSLPKLLPPFVPYDPSVKGKG